MTRLDSFFSISILQPAMQAQIYYFFYPSASARINRTNHRGIYPEESKMGLLPLDIKIAPQDTSWYNTQLDEACPFWHPHTSQDTSDLKWPQPRGSKNSLSVVQPFWSTERLEPFILRADLVPDTGERDVSFSVCSHGRMFFGDLNTSWVQAWTSILVEGCQYICPRRIKNDLVCWGYYKKYFRQSKL